MERARLWFKIFQITVWDRVAWLDLLDSTRKNRTSWISIIWHKFFFTFFFNPRFIYTVITCRSIIQSNCILVNISHESAKLNFRENSIEAARSSTKKTKHFHATKAHVPLARWKRGIVLLRTVFIPSRCDVPFSRYRRLKATFSSRYRCPCRAIVHWPVPSTPVSDRRWVCVFFFSLFLFFSFFYERHSRRTHF